MSHQTGIDSVMFSSIFSRKKCQKLQEYIVKISKKSHVLLLCDVKRDLYSNRASSSLVFIYRNSSAILIVGGHWRVKCFVLSYKFSSPVATNNTSPMIPDELRYMKPGFMNQTDCFIRMNCCINYNNIIIQLNDV